MQNAIHCDVCDEQIVIKPQLKKHGDGVQETYFNCPHCDERYTAYVTNAEIRKRQREIKRLGELLHKITDKVKYQKAFEKYQNRKAELEPMMNVLKYKIEMKVL